jgi:hypothetical protein
MAQPIALDSDIYRWAAWAGVALLAAGVLYVFFAGTWSQLLQGALFLAGVLLLIIFNDRLPSLLVMLFVLAAMVNAAGWVWNEYKTPGYDEFAHLFTTFAVTLALGFLAYWRVQHHFRRHPVHFVLVISSFGISLGALWEVFEWTLIGELRDPVGDIIVDSIGAILAGIAAPWLIDEKRTAAAQHENRH